MAFRFCERPPFLASFSDFARKVPGHYSADFRGIAGFGGASGPDARNHGGKFNRKRDVSPTESGASWFRRLVAVERCGLTGRSQRGAGRSPWAAVCAASQPPGAARQTANGRRGNLQIVLFQRQITNAGGGIENVASGVRCPRRKLHRSYCQCCPLGTRSRREFVSASTDLFADMLYRFALRAGFLPRF